jgi:tetratricopeptide (TPR) repeat protein
MTMAVTAARGVLLTFRLDTGSTIPGTPYNDPSMSRTAIVALIVLTAAAPALAQSPSASPAIVGVHTPVRGDTPELAQQLARVDGQRKAWQAVVKQLQARKDVQAVRLTPAQLEAFTAVIVEATAAPAQTAAPAAGAPLQRSMRVRFEPAGAARRMAALRSDPETTSAIVGLWSAMQQLHQQLAAQTKQRATAPATEAERVAREQLETIRALDVKHLRARATNALAHTEPATVGGRVATEANRVLAGRLGEEARVLAPDSFDVHLLTGDLLHDAERPGEAEVSYRKALALNADSSAAHHKLAEVLRLQGKFDESIAELREVMRLDPKSAGAHTDLALILGAQDKADEALAEYREAIRIDPDWSDAHNGLAVAFARTGRLEEAIAEFREVIRIDPESTIGHFNMATALAGLDRDAEAAASLREVIRIYPDHYNAHYNLGEMFRLEGKFDEAAKQFREYVRIAPDTPQNQRNIRRARQYVQQFSEEK